MCEGRFGAPGERPPELNIHTTHNMASPRPSKAPSITSSAGTTKSTSLPFLPRYTPKPEPAYISPAAAADFVLHSRNDDQLDQISPSASPTNEGAVFSERSLSLLNSFLDSLLYNFLAKARGTSLSQLKPAIIEVLKAKLARDALASADEELEGLVGEADLDETEDVTTFGGREGWSQEWHLEMAFKRMRLRVMVFIRLGDFDDEDEERFLDEEDDLRNGETLEQEDMLASPAAVYLAGVLEYIAERALGIAGDAAWKRAAGKSHRRLPSDQSEVSDIRGLVVQDADVEKITLNPTLGRLWRTWRKNYRVASGGSATSSLMPSASPTYDAFRGRLGSLNETMATTAYAEQGDRDDKQENRSLSADEIPEGDVLESDIAANIPLPISDNDVEEIETIEAPDLEAVAAMPLPMGDNDVNEIEVPGLAKEIVDDEEVAVAAEEEERSRRPISVILSWLTPFSWTPEQPQRPQLQRLRSSSVPTRNRPAFLGAEVFTPAVEKVDPVEHTVEDDVATRAEDERAAQAPEVVEASPVSEPTTVIADEEVPPVAAASVSEKRAELPESEAQVAEEKAEIPAEKTEKPHEPEEESHKSGIIAGAVAGAAALAGTAAAIVTGSSTKDSSPEDSLKPEVVAKDDEKPKSPVSNSIADRRRMFESQAKAGKPGSPVSREVSPAPAEERKSVVVQDPPARKSSLKTQTATVAGAAAVAPAVPKVEEVMQAPPPPPQKEVDSRVDRKASEEPQAAHDERAIGVARTSDVPVPYPKATQTSSPPPERQRPYHLPGNQSPQAYQGSGRQSPPQRNANRDRALVGADTYLLSQEQSGSKSMPVQAATKPETRSNGVMLSSQEGPQNVTFYHSDAEDKNEPEVHNSASRPRPPPLKTAIPEPAETPLRPTSGTRSAGSTPGGHSTKGSHSSSSMQRQLDKKSLEESRQRDFDSLLKNDQPIKYTLTPDDLRTNTNSTTVTRTPALADRGPPSPRIISSPSSYAAKRSPPRQSSSTRRETPSPTTGLAGGRKAGVPRVSEYKRAAANRLSQRPEELNVGLARSGFMPREPRVMTDNTADLADYMASTAPAHEQTVTPLARAADNSRLNTSRTSSPLPRGTSRQRLVPREPDVKKDGTSDLIDFIRQGPPGSKPEREQRRTVAPFRSTMDSEDFNKLGDFSSSMDKSFGGSKRNSSFGSSGLLGNSSSAPARGNLVTPGGPPIVKKQRRVKDPYAIDSDDEDDFLTSLPPGGRAVQEPQEESLADFLRNSEPPSGNAPQVLNSSSNSRGFMSRSGSNTTKGSGNGANTKSSMITSGFSLPSISKMKFEARAAGATRNGFGGNGFYYSTNDMADFLRSSGPIENMAPPQQPPLQKKPSKRLGSVSHRTHASNSSLMLTMP